MLLIRYLTLFLAAAAFTMSGRMALTDALDDFSKDRPVIIVAHRSADLGGAPENSLSWITAALDLGVDGIHINPQMTADDRYVLMHDSTLNRMTNVESVFPEGPPGGPARAERGGLDYVRDYAIGEIERLRLASATGEPTEGVPSLREALDLVDGRALVFLGLKTYEIDSLAAALEAKPTENIVLFELYYSGTDQSKLRKTAEITGLPVAVSLFRSRDYVTDLERVIGQLGPHLRMVSVDSRGLTPAFRERLEEQGIRLWTSGMSGPEDRALRTNKDSAPWEAALAISEAVLTDHPALVLQLLGR